MVSPRNAVPGLNISYADRVLIAVHEYAHLVNNEIDPDMPTWLNEGAAIYAGPHAVYDTVCRQGIPLGPVPRLGDLEQSYDAIPAADLFAYTLVDFIAARHGHTVLNRLLRSPDAFETILGASRNTVEADWHAYVRQHCANP
jgi:hypothetical protein